MKEKELTAVKWLINELELDMFATDEEMEIIIKAKEMEKEQIIDFGYDIAEDLAWGKYRDKKAMEERYNEFLMYKQQEQ
jgi:hypothetical protein